MEEKQTAQAEEARAEGAQAEAFVPRSVIKTLLLSKKKAKALGYPKKWLVILDIKEWVLSILFAVVAVIIIKAFLAWPITVDGQSMVPTLSGKDKLLVTSYDVRFGSAPRRGDVVICHYYGRTNKWLGILTVKTDFVKRVVGVPGDTIKRVSGVTFVNGVALDPAAPYKRLYNSDQYSYTVNEDGSISYFLNGLPFTWPSYTYVKNEDGSITYYKNGEQMDIRDDQSVSREFDYEYVLGKDEYFVVGDNRYNSHDSRKWNGPDLPVSYINSASGSVGPITKDMITGHVRCVFWPIGEARKVENDPDYMHPDDRQ